MSSIFDIFSDQPAKDAANAQIAGINAGKTAATGDINQAIGSLNTNYTNALQPVLTNYNQAQGGVTQLQNLLGLNGQQGTDAAMKTLQNTPGYQFQLQQGNNSINAAAAANGTLASGKQLIDLSNYNQGLAGTTYQNAVNNLQPFLSSSNTNAGGIAGTYTGLGNATAGQYNKLANLDYTAATDIGSANANADLARYNASGNLWNAIGGIGGSIFGALGGSSPISGAIGPTSVGGAPLSGGTGLGSIMSMFGMSDRRLKEDISPIGELYDGQPVYRYKYLNDPIWRMGLMAQDVEQHSPQAVRDVGGFKAVNYKDATDMAASLSRFLEAA